jgi:hypothetical protein
MLLALAGGSIDHSLAPEFHGLTSAREDRERRRATGGLGSAIGPAPLRDADADVA